MRKTLSLELILKLYLLCCNCGTTLLLLHVGTLSNIVPHLLTNKSLHFNHISLLTTTSLSSTPLWWGPKFRTLPTATIGLLLSLCPKSKILIAMT
jgi:hypothetical protein